MLLTLTFLEGYSIAETAAMMDMTPINVRILYVPYMFSQRNHSVFREHSLCKNTVICFLKKAIQTKISQIKKQHAF